MAQAQRRDLGDATMIIAPPLARRIPSAAEPLSPAAGVRWQTVFKTMLIDFLLDVTTNEAGKTSNAISSANLYGIDGRLFHKEHQDQHHPIC
jgi:hypothetical protein